MNLHANSVIMGESEQCGNTALTHISDLLGGHQLPTEDSSTRLIPLTKGKFAIVDAADYHLVSQYRWRAREKRRTFYALAEFNDASGKQIHLRMHRVILGITDPKVFCDHRDGDGLNNRRSNLRQCTDTQNKQNSRRRIGNLTSRFRGVSLKRESGRWRAAIGGGAKRTKLYLGTFKSEEEAARVYDAAALKHFGEFARLNFPKDNPNEQ